MRDEGECSWNDDTHHREEVQPVTTILPFRWLQYWLTPLPQDATDPDQRKRQCCGKQKRIPLGDVIMPVIVTVERSQRLPHVDAKEVEGWNHPRIVEYSIDDG